MTSGINLTTPVLRPDVSEWLLGLACVADDALLEEMHRGARERNSPIVGPEAGRFLAQITRLVGAKRIFEMGAGLGYCTLWMARAAGEGSTIYHTDVDPEMTAVAREYLTRAGVADRVVFLTGDARQHLAATPGEFDLVLCDIEKDQYPSAFELFRDRVRVGGAVIVDNLLWSGKVAAGVTDVTTSGVREYVRLMWSDTRYLSSLLPVRDGLGLSLRVS